MKKIFKDMHTQRGVGGNGDRERNRKPMSKLIKVKNKE